MFNLTSLGRRPSTHPNQPGINRSAALLVASAGRPDSLFETQLGRAFVESIDSRAVAPSRNTIRRTSNDPLLDEAHTSMSRVLSIVPYVTVTFDGWTIRSVHYIGVTAHGATVPTDDQPPQLIARLLGLKRVHGSATARVTADAVKQLLDIHKLHPRLVAATTDTAAVMPATIELLRAGNADEDGDDSDVSPRR